MVSTIQRRKCVFCFLFSFFFYIYKCIISSTESTVGLPILPFFSFYLYLPFFFIRIFFWLIHVCCLFQFSFAFFSCCICIDPILMENKSNIESQLYRNTCFYQAKPSFLRMIFFSVLYKILLCGLNIRQRFFRLFQSVHFIVKDP